MTPGPLADAAPEIDLFHAGGREAEIEEVFRRIMSACRSISWRSPAPPMPT